MTYRSIPPAAQDDASTWENDALIAPQIVSIDIVEVVRKMLHEGDALPAGDTTLVRQLVEPAGDMKALVTIFALAIEPDI